MHKATVNIMGMPYTIETGEISREELRENDGVCKIEDREIILREARDMVDQWASETAAIRRFAYVLRHELVHAIAAECGVQYGDDEALVDWIAHIAPIVMRLQEDFYENGVNNGPDSND